MMLHRTLGKIPRAYVLFSTKVRRRVSASGARTPLSRAGPDSRASRVYGAAPAIAAGMRALANISRSHIRVRPNARVHRRSQRRSRRIHNKRKELDYDILRPACVGKRLYSGDGNKSVFIALVLLQNRKLI